MSLILAGQSRNVSSPLSATVVSMASNGSGAVRVTTSAAHYFGNDNLVSMYAPPVLGDWKITVIDSTHFDLQGSTFTTTGTGTVKCRSLTPQVQVPTDGDTASLQLSGMLSAQQAMLDRTQFLAEQRSKYQLYNQYQSTGGTILPPWHSSPWSTNNNFTSTSAVIVPSSVQSLQALSDTPSGPAPQLTTSDILAIRISGSCYAVTTSSADAVLALGIGWTQDGSTLLGEQGWQMLTAWPATGELPYQHFCLDALIYASSIPGSGGTLPGTLSLCLAGRLDSAPASGQVNWLFTGPVNYTAMQYRANL